MQGLHLQGDVLNEMLAAFVNRFEANGILVTPRVALNLGPLTPTVRNK